MREEGIYSRGRARSQWLSAWARVRTLGQVKGEALVAAPIAALVLCAAAALTGHVPRAGTHDAVGGTRTFESAVVASSSCGTRRKPPKVYRHVVWIVMENKGYSQIIDSANAPYINALAQQCGVATRFAAESHPSLPNYIAMTTGSLQGISDDSDPSAHRLFVPSIFSQLGTTWRALAESMPSNCYRTNAGLYAVRHNPAVYFTNIRTRECMLQDVPLGRRPNLTGRFTFVTPNICHDMHSCPTTGDDEAAQTRAGDDWLATFVPKVLSSPQYRSGAMAVFVTWDEGSLDNHIATLVLSPYTHPGTTSPALFNHYSLLRTTEDMLGLHAHIANAAGAPSMRAAFHL